MEQSKWEINWHLESKFIKYLTGNISKERYLQERASLRGKNEFMIFKALKIKIFLTKLLLLRIFATFPPLSLAATTNTTFLPLRHPLPTHCMFRSFFKVHMRLKTNLLADLDEIHRWFCWFMLVFRVLSALHFRTWTNQENYFCTLDRHYLNIDL